MIVHRSRIQLAILACAIALATASVIDRAGGFGYRGNDWTHFDQKSFNVARCIDGDTIVVADETGAETVVQLLGVDAPEHEKSKIYTTVRTKDRTVTLRLEPIQSRNKTGELLAYVFITDGDNLNADVIRDGHGYSDRRVKHTFASQFNVAENEARKKPRGLWVDLSEDQMPGWRRGWLRSLRRN